ncbi:MAG: UDP-glucose--hexose-1-phosphate uridylyltransferase [Balneola sp.]|nr:MAG: UDP-glucose--hexose-1-phosphate uridylyltransferase [Balneola sp.]
MTSRHLEYPHRRLNILTGEWVQVSAHRTKRPWQGQQEEVNIDTKPEYDPSCYLCPGNKRANGVINPHYSSTYSFVNDFSALIESVPDDHISIEGLLVSQGEPGICKVICFSPKHNRTLPDMSVSEIRKVVECWVHEYVELGSRENINYVQIFENKGEIMGCSNAHPHGQIWAQKSIPTEPEKERIRFEEYFKEYGRTILTDYLELELSLQERIVAENDDFVVLVPFWAFWPFETLIISRRPISRLDEFSDSEKTNFAHIIQTITRKYDKVFNVSFPYSAGLHPAPTDGGNYPEWHFHMHFYPPLLRSSTIKKFSVGYELLANLQRDTTPEYSANILKKISI